MVKRKFDDELMLADEQLTQHKAKRQFLSLEVQSMDVDMDITMDQSSSPVTAGTSTLDSSPVHIVTALPSNEPQVAYPSFDLYPLPGMDVDTTVSSSIPATPAVGLMQPASQAGGFAQHGPQCTTIPKLRMSCAAGMYGRRTMWTHCETCGAIEMVE
ncbi:hypothetical protein BKA62DRAFT_667086 [Auriculariales sp. MPI-PUGE-AT-0066]|nr:hypothetical protein BKA62DRAFT_667086 [Auriculariales sp. MPI-PUGE-AT-0066]